MLIIYVACFFVITAFGTPFFRVSNTSVHEYFVHDMPVESYAGQVPIIRSHTDSTEQNIFFWYFPPTFASQDHPIIIWIQGGPGSSSMIGLFSEHGPLGINSNGKIVKRAHSWNERYGVVYVDNPVGTGYSLAKSEEYLECIDKIYNDDVPVYCGPFAVNQKAVAADIQIFIHKFNILFPHLSNSPLFLAGESYAGKYIPNIASLLLQDDQINLKGVMIGDGLIDPAAQITEIPQQAASLAVVSPIQMNHLQVIVRNAIAAGAQGELLLAADLRNSLFQNIQEYSGGISFYDIRLEEDDNPWEHIQEFMQLESTKRLLNIPRNSTFTVRSSTIKRIFYGDVFKSALNQLDEILEKKLPTLLFAGQYDSRDGIPGQYSLISKLRWKDKITFLNSSRIPWLDGQHIIGYSTAFHPLEFIELRGAGHLAPMNQPLYCKKMIERFIEKAIEL